MLGEDFQHLHSTGLANAVRTCRCLLVLRWGPALVSEDDIAASGQGDALFAGCDGANEHLAVTVRLELGNFFGPLRHLDITVYISRVVLLQLTLEDAGR